MLLHPTSLPSRWGIGDLGPEARRFVEFLAAAGQRVWQMLPVGPVGYGNSPYSAQSTYAGNPLLISLDDLVADGLLGTDDLDGLDSLGGAQRSISHKEKRPARVDYGAVGPFHHEKLLTAFGRFQGRRAGTRKRADFDAFSDESRAWLDDFALYAALKRAHGGVSFLDWTEPLKMRRPAALVRARAQLAEEMAFHRFEQWLFARQWQALRQHAEAHGVALVGDVPLYVAEDSADVWAHPELFQLDARRRPAVVAGVPPDYFSRTGQLWGNPLYRWGAHKKLGYAWWAERLGATLARFDAVRLDHFIGFTRSWAIPAGATTAASGRFQRGPGEELFRAVAAALGRPVEKLPLIAEDLGLVTPEVQALRERLGLPGIKILQFAFGDDPQAPSFLPHNYARHSVAYTGTHDNDTTCGWFGAPGGEADTRSPAQVALERRAALDYLGLEAEPHQIHWAMIRCLFSSVAELAMVPMQDLLGLGSEERMNRPGVASGNWEWRMEPGAASPEIAARLLRLGEVYGRAAATTGIKRRAS